MLDSQIIPISRLFRFIRFDAPNVMRCALHQLTDQATGLTSDFATRGGWSGLESLRFTGVSRIKFTHQGAKKRKYYFFHVSRYVSMYLFDDII